MKRSFRPSLLLISIILIGFAPIYSFAQYSLPKVQILVKDSIRIIHVTKTALRKENRYHKTISTQSVVQKRQLLTSYFINRSGRIDSVYRYYNDPSKYNKQLFHFGKDNQLQEVLWINTKGDSTQRSLLLHTPKQELHLRTWNQGILTYDLKATPDSLIYETTTYQSFSPILRYTKTLYNHNEKTMAILNYQEEDLVAKELFQWFAKDGIPYFFKHRKITYNEQREESVEVDKEYAVAEDGSIYSQNKGLFTDPFHSHNYFTWQKRYHGLEHPYYHLLRNNSLFMKQESAEIYDFEGNSIVYGYTMEYEKY